MGGAGRQYPYTGNYELRIRGQRVDIRNLLTTATLAVALLLSPALQASNVSNADRQAAEEKARNYFTNLEVIDQDGRKLRFYDDVLKDKVVAINFIFTNCQGACPLMTRHMTLVRDTLGADLGKDIHFISISVDPVRDTPAAMKEFAETHDADQPGWRFLTGSPDNLETIVRKLGQYTDELEAHSTLLIAANVRTAHWTKVPPNVPPDGVVQRLRMLIEEDAPDR
jgi:cytochrome oxidase Cu insertion factor (SCO1/SenC/PrrC family)